MKKTCKPTIALVGSEESETDGLRCIIEEGPYLTKTYSCLDALKSGLRADPHMAAILDIDSIPLDNRTIRRLTMEFPLVCFFCTSHDRFHPELKDAICHHLFACLRKPVNPDELHYFLKCIHENEGDSRGPPSF